MVKSALSIFFLTTLAAFDANAGELRIAGPEAGQLELRLGGGLLAVLPYADAGIDYGISPRWSVAGRLQTNGVYTFLNTSVEYVVYHGEVVSLFADLRGVSFLNFIFAKTQSYIAMVGGDLGARFYLGGAVLEIGGGVAVSGVDYVFSGNSSYAPLAHSSLVLRPSVAVGFLVGEDVRLDIDATVYYGVKRDGYEVEAASRVMPLLSCRAAW